MKSPFLGLRRLLRFYSWAGILPARLDGRSGSTLEYQPWRYVIAVVFWLSFALSLCCMFQLSHDERCLAERMTWDNLKNGASGFDVAVSFSHVIIFASIIAVSTVLHHRCVKRYDSLVDSMAGLPDAPDVSFRAPLVHHALVTLIGVPQGLLLFAASALNLGADFLCVDSILYAFLTVVTRTYGLALAALPEVTFAAFCHTLAASMKQAAKDYSRTGDLLEFCKRQRKYHAVIGHLESVYGPVLLFSFAALTVLLTICSYFAFVCAFKYMEANSPAVSYIWLVMNLLIILQCCKRILHVTNYSQRLFRRVDEAVDVLILSDVGGPHRQQALQTKALMERLDGGIPVLGLFTLKRTVILAIVGNILTYVIILVEFRLN